MKEGKTIFIPRMRTKKYKLFYISIACVRELDVKGIMFVYVCLFKNSRPHPLMHIATAID